MGYEDAPKVAGVNLDPEMIAARLRLPWRAVLRGRISGARIPADLAEWRRVTQRSST